MHQSAGLPEAWNGCPRCRGIDAHLPWNTHIDHIKANYVSKTLTKIGRTSWSEVSFRDIGRDLRASGMISDASDWRDLTEAEFAEQIHEIGVAAKCIYSRIPVEVAEALAS